MSETARTNSPRRAASTALALATALACAVLVGGCIRIPLNSEGNIFPRPKPAPTHGTGSGVSIETSAAGVGEAQTGGSWRVTVTKARAKSKGPGGASAGAGKQWLLLETEFKNVKIAETLIVRPKYATLTSASGKTYATVGTSQGFNGHGMREIGPGLGGWRVFAFRVPKGSTGYTFTFAPKSEGKRVKLKWTVP